MNIEYSPEYSAAPQADPEAAKALAAHKAELEKTRLAEEEAKAVALLEESKKKPKKKAAKK